MGEVTPIDPQKVKCIFAGRRLTHFVKGTYINAEPQGDGITIAKGLLDTASVVIDPDSSANVTLTLMQGKFDNEFLSNLHRKQRRGIVGSKSLLIKVLGGTTIIESHSVFVQQYAAQGFSNEAEQRQWVLVCAKCQTFNVGGNSPT